MIKNIFHYLLSFALILIALAIGIHIQQFLNTSVPGSVIGMLLLFFSLASGLIPEHWVKPTANLFLRYMVLLFIPISVGLIEQTDILSEYALQIFASTLGGTFIMIVLLSLLLQKILAGKK